MRLAILSDIHANTEALDAVLDDLETRRVDVVVCLGDIAGYGPDPVPVVDRIRDVCSAAVRGNHDAALTSDDELDGLPKDGRAAARLHRQLLRPDQVEWLSALPLVSEVAGVTLAHAAPRHPERWPRLDSFRAVREQFDAFDTDVCFVGHSHLPAVLSDRIGVLRVRPGARFLINVGSVGQPRDRDPRAAYGLYDTETMEYELVRVRYDASRTAARIHERGLPDVLGERLLIGL